MLRRILVPLDGSASAVQALRVAARLARSHGASLILTRIVPAPVGLAVSPALPDVWASAAAPVDRMEALDYLRELASVQQLVGIDVQVLAPAGPVAPTIAALARLCAADLVVLCRSRHHGSTYWMYGDVAREVVRLAPSAVLILRSDAEDETDALLSGRQSRQAVVALDGSRAAEAALLPAAALVCGLSAVSPGALHLVRLVSDPVGQAVARAYLRTVAERLNAHDPHLRVTWSVEVDTDVAQRVTWVAQYGPDVEEARTRPGMLRGWVEYDTARPAAYSATPAIIALAAYGAHGPREAEAAATTEELLHSAPLPLLIVPPACQVARMPRLLGPQPFVQSGMRRRAVPRGSALATTPRARYRGPRTIRARGRNRRSPR